MSIQSEITRISGKVTEQTALIEEIGSILEGKAAAVPILQRKSVRPSLDVQEITPDSGFDGLSEVTVDQMKLMTAVPMVTMGSGYEIITPDEGYDGFKDIYMWHDDNLKPENIAEGVSIFNVKGTHKAGLDGWTTGTTKFINVSPPRATDPGDGPAYIVIPGLTKIPTTIYLSFYTNMEDRDNKYLCLNGKQVGSDCFNGAYRITEISIVSEGCKIYFGAISQFDTDETVTYAYNTTLQNKTTPEVNSITATGSYTSSTYQQGYWAAITNGKQLIITVKGGTSTSYESIYFTNASVPSGVTLLGQSYYSYSSMTAGQMYVAVYSGITSDVNITLNFNSTNSSSDYVQCAVTIANV